MVARFYGQLWSVPRTPHRCLRPTYFSCAIYHSLDWEGSLSYVATSQGVLQDSGVNNESPRMSHNLHYLLNITSTLIFIVPHDGLYNRYLLAIEDLPSAPSLPMMLFHDLVLHRGTCIGLI